MLVRHDITLLRSAVNLALRRAEIPTKQAEAAAADKLSKAVAVRRLATGAAIACAAVGVGLGVWLSRESREALSPVAASKIDPVDPRKTIGPSKVTLDFSKFATRTETVAGKQWDITTGHQFEKDSDPVWSSAWCYTGNLVNGVSVRIDLARRASSKARPTALLANPETLDGVGLNDPQALFLATKCPWLDGKSFTETDFVTSERRISKPVRPSIVNPNSPNTALPESINSPSTTLPISSGAGAAPGLTPSPTIPAPTSVGAPRDLVGPRTPPAVMKIPPPSAKDPSAFGIY